MDNEITSYRPLFQQREYIKLVAANVINRFGDSIDAIAFAWLMYEITQSAALMALIRARTICPRCFCSRLRARWSSASK
jgi:hypothetical protein